MIHYFAEFRLSLLNFIEEWAPELRPYVLPHSYPAIPFLRGIGEGIFIFSDLERLPSWKRTLGRRFIKRIEGKAGTVILNNPDRSLGRFPLLTRLHQQGINTFRVGRLEDASALKYPIFLRSEVDHRGSATDLLHSPEDLQRARAGLSWKNRWRQPRLMLEEFVNCVGQDGLFRKYSVMNVHGTLIPRHVLFSRNWVTKHADFVSDDTVREEQAFLGTFPHEKQVREVFALAAIGYGRIDYGVKDGRIQVWEINTNPTVVPAPRNIDPRRMPGQQRSARQIADALLALATKP